MREEVKIEQRMELPEECRVRVFIPAFLYDSNQCCYCIDLHENKIISWSIKINQINKALKRLIGERKNVKPSFDIDSFLTIMHAVHSVKSYKREIFVFANSNYMLHLNPDRANDDYVIFNQIDKIYSGTNSILNGMVYFAQWNMFDALARTSYEELIPVELGTYDIENRKIRILDSIKGPDNIHQVYLTENEESILLIEMGRLLHGNIGPEYAKDKMQRMEILKRGPQWSHIIKYCIRDGKCQTKLVPDVPGHAAACPLERNHLLISCHNLVGNYSYGPGRILKIGTDNLDFVNEFSCDDLIRIPNLSLFPYKNDYYIMTNGYPQRLFIIGCKDLKLYKKSFLGKSEKKADFSDGPYNVESTARTPFSLLPIRNTSYYFTVDPFQITLRDFETGERIAYFSYNYNKKNIMGTGHATILVEENDK